MGSTTLYACTSICYNIESVRVLVAAFELGSVAGRVYIARDKKQRR